MPPESLTRESTDTETDTSGGVNVMEGRDSDAVSEGSPEETTTDVADSSTATELKSDFDPTQPTTDDLETDTGQPTSVDPNQDISTTAEAIQGQTQALLDTLDSQEQESQASDLESEVQTREDRQQELIQGIEDTFSKLADRGERRNELASDFGLSEQRTQLADVTQQLREEKRSLEEQKERIRNQPGLSASQQQARIDEISRKSADKQADLALQQQAATGAIQAMQTTIDRKIQNEFQPQRQRLKRLKFQFQNNKDLLTTKEQQLYEQNLRQEEREFKKDRAERENFLQTKRSIVAQAQKNGAPSDVLSDVMSADDIETAAEAAGEYASAQTTQGFTLSEGERRFDEEGNLVAGFGGGQQDGQLTRAERNNNPLNLKDPETGEFRQFDTVQEGLQAAKQDLKNKMTGATSTDVGPDSTLRDLIDTWAPPEDNNLNNDNYAQKVANDLGVSTDTKIGNLTNQVDTMARSMAEFEGFDFEKQKAMDRVKTEADLVMRDGNKYDIGDVPETIRWNVKQEVADREPESQKQKETQANNLYTLAQDIKKHPAFEASVGQASTGVVGAANPGTYYRRITGERTDFKAAASQLLNQLTVDNLEKMSGTLSDNDIAILTGAASKLGVKLPGEQGRQLRTDIPEEAFKKELNKIMDTIGRNVDVSNMSEQGAQETAGIEGDDKNDIDSIYGDTQTTTQTGFNPDDYIE